MKINYFTYSSSVTVNITTLALFGLKNRELILADYSISFSCFSAHLFPFIFYFQSIVITHHTLATTKFIRSFILLIRNLLFRIATHHIHFFICFVRRFRGFLRLLKARVYPLLSGFYACRFVINMPNCIAPPTYSLFP